MILVLIYASIRISKHPYLLVIINSPDEAKNIDELEYHFSMPVGSKACSRYREAKMIKIYFIGFVVLIGAIVVNVLANRIGIMGWYEYLRLLEETGLQSIFTPWLIYLLVIYPLILGGLAYGAELIWNTWLMH